MQTSNQSQKPNKWLTIGVTPPVIAAKMEAETLAKLAKAYKPGPRALDHIKICRDILAKYEDFTFAELAADTGKKPHYWIHYFHDFKLLVPDFLTLAATKLSGNKNGRELRYKLTKKKIDELEKALAYQKAKRVKF